MGVTVADARFMKPLDVDLIRRLAGEHDAMLTVEENAIGGFGAHVLHFMVLDGLMDDVSFNLYSVPIPPARPPPRAELIVVVRLYCAFVSGWLVPVFFHPLPCVVASLFLRRHEDGCWICSRCLSRC